MYSSFFFFNDTATTEIYTLSLHDALPISLRLIADHHHAGVLHLILIAQAAAAGYFKSANALIYRIDTREDRKSTRLNSSHTVISYAVFCLKKKKKRRITSSRLTAQEHRPP